MPVRTADLAEVGVEEPQHVVDLGERRHRGAGVAHRVAGHERHRREDVADLVDLRPLALFEEVARVGGHRLHEAAVPLGVDGVEGERRLAGTGQAGHHHERIAWQVDVHILQIVFARAANGEKFLV